MLKENVPPVNCQATRLRCGRRQSRWRHRWALGVHVLFHRVSVYAQLPGDPTQGQPLAFRLLHRFPPGRLQRRGLPASLRRSFTNSSSTVAAGGGDGMLGGVVGVQSRQLGRPFSTQTVGGLIDNG